MNDGLLYETMLAKLGSRMTLTMQPGKHKSRLGALGFYHDYDANLTVAARCGDDVRIIPIGDRLPATRAFESIEQSIGLCSVEYACRSERLPFGMNLRVVAPFYPGDVKLSTAPFHYLVFTVDSRASTDVTGSVLLASDNPYQYGGFSDGTKALSALYREEGLIGFTMEGLDIDNAKLLFATEDEGVSYCVEDNESKVAEIFAQHGRLPDKVVLDCPAYFQTSGLCWEFNLKPGERLERVFVVAGYHQSHALKVLGEDKRFNYTEMFPDVESVARYALESYPGAMCKVSLFESTLGDSSLSDDAKNLVAYAVQSYIANTWWVEDDWFSVWEGRCRFHSTLDVAYNTELFTLQYWPDLLRMQLDEWSRFRIGRYISHDIGDDRVIFGQSYSADMPVEECCNYLLLLYGYWKTTGDGEFVKDKATLARELVEYVLSTDLDGDGVPDEPGAVINTIDDAVPSTGRSSCQTYLAVKVLAMYVVAKEMFGIDLAAHMERIRGTLKHNLWTGSQYLVCAGLPGSSGIYSGNGLLYLLLAGTVVPLDLSTFRKDIEVTTPALMRAYGCTHSSHDRTTWISQNIWRDLVGMYLGLDMMENASRYWRFQQERNTWDTGCFTDTYHYGIHSRDLDKYPRGATGTGYFLAVAGLTVDRPAGRLGFAPIHDKVRVPVLVAAEWARDYVPWLDWEVEGETAKVRLEECPGFSRISIEAPEAVRRVNLNYAGNQAEIPVGGETTLGNALISVTRGGEVE